MPKRLHHTDGPPYPANGHAAWSIGSSRLTAVGQNELLKHIGRRLQADYEGILKEPVPDRIRGLIERLESYSPHLDDHPDTEDGF